MTEKEDSLIEILDHTTIHGLNHIYSEKRKPWKIFWLILFVMGICGLFFNLFALVEKYMFKIVVVNKFVGHEIFVWPDLTFCNPTAPYNLENNSATLIHWKETMKQTESIVNAILKENKLFKTIKTFDNNLREIVENAVSMSTVDPMKMEVDNFRKQILFYGYTENHPKIYFIKEYDHHYTDLVKEDPIELFSTQFVQIRNNIPCQTFQIGKSRSIKFNDVHSLKFFINLNYESYETFNSSYIPRSLLLFVTTRNLLPKGDVITIMPGFNTEAIIHQLRFDNHESRYPCRKESYEIELYNTLLQNTTLHEGDFEDCRKVISQTLYVEKCRCYSPFLPIYKNNSGFPQLCLNATIFSKSEILKNIDCMYEVYQNYSTNSTFEQVENETCSTYKKDKCDDLTYTVEPRKEAWIESQTGKMNVRMDGFIRNAYQKLFNKEITGQNYLKEFKDNVAMLSIRRASKHGNLAKEKLEYSYSNLLSDIGGLMGFCLGLSIFGIIESVGMVYLLLMRLCGYEVNKVKKKKDDKLLEQNVEMNAI